MCRALGSQSHLLSPGTLRQISALPEAWGMTSPLSAEWWSTGSLFDLVLRGCRALPLLTGCSWFELGVEVDAFSSPGVLGVSPPDFFLNKRNKNDFTSCSFQNVGQETPVSPHLLGMGNTVNNICLGCWPSKFVFLSTTGNASSPNHPLALKRIKHNNNKKTNKNL